METEGPKFERKLGRGIKVEMKNTASLNRLANKQLENPISMIQVGTNTFIYTKYPLKNVLKDKEDAIRGPVTTEKEQRQIYQVDMRYSFLAELEDGVELSSDGEGHFELTETSSGKKAMLLDLSQQLKYLKTASAFEVKKDPDPNTKDLETILAMHAKRKKESTES